VGGSFEVVLDSDDVLGAWLETHEVELAVTLLVTSSDVTTDDAAVDARATTVLADRGGKGFEGLSLPEPGRVGHFEVTETLERAIPKEEEGRRWESKKEAKEGGERKAKEGKSEEGTRKTISVS
jgi:hypothetical protein